MLLAAGVMAATAAVGNTMLGMWLRRREAAATAKFLESSPEISFVHSRGHRLVVRTVRPPAGNTAPSRATQVFLPNGMACTAAMIGPIQELLARAGYTSVTYDRYGCGWSDAIAEGVSPTVEETLQDMKAVYDAAFPGAATTTGSGGAARPRVVLLGGSMGSIVGQCFVAAYPGHLGGFLNVDGVPHPFFRRRGLFQRFFGSIYKLEALLAKTGAFRPCLALARGKVAFLATSGVPLDRIMAQLNDPQFFANVGFEMKLMMDLCEYDAGGRGGGVSQRRRRVLSD
jgi:pimeloyl-ACP methyl ester carboxylesterase